MERVQYVIAGFDRPAEAGDLGTTLTALSGVARIELDVAAHSVSVDYDPAFVSETLVEQTIKRAGYPDLQRAGAAGSERTQ